MKYTESELEKLNNGCGKTYEVQYIYDLAQELYPDVKDRDMRLDVFTALLPFGMYVAEEIINTLAEAVSDNAPEVLYAIATKNLISLESIEVIKRLRAQLGSDEETAKALIDSPEKYLPKREY